MVSALDFRSGGRGSSLVTAVVLFQTKNCISHCLSSPRGINGYRRSKRWGEGGGGYGV